MSLLEAISGHAYTVLPTLKHRLRPLTAPAAIEWTRAVTTDLGAVDVRALYRDTGGDTLVVAVHGLGGSPESGYLTPIAIAADRRGWSCARLALRGADGRGGDFYHSGLTADLRDLLTAPDFARYERVFVVGFSLGGHIALRAATEPELSRRMTAVAAVCPPLDLSAGADYLDHRARTGYRQYILRSLVDMYSEIARQKDLPTPVDAVRRARTIRGYDELTVVPRYGFRDAEDYYQSCAIAGNVEEISVRALMVHSPHDPMIPRSSVEPVLRRAPPDFEVRWVSGAGHVYFPRSLDLGWGDEPGLAPQLMSWFEG